jgi:hypothetical protein
MWRESSDPWFHTLWQAVVFAVVVVVTSVFLLFPFKFLAMQLVQLVFRAAALDANSKYYCALRAHTLRHRQTAPKVTVQVRADRRGPDQRDCAHVERRRADPSVRRAV